VGLTDYLEYEEIDVFLEIVNRASVQGSGDYALLRRGF
jgi:hypothetical protein